MDVMILVYMYLSSINIFCTVATYTVQWYLRDHILYKEVEIKYCSSYEVW